MHRMASAPMSELAIPIAQAVDSAPVKPLFSAFVARTLGWVAAQLVLTVSVCVGMYVKRDVVAGALRAHPLALWGMAIATFVALAVMYAAKTHGQKLVAFAAFTLSTSGLVGVAILPYSPSAILLAAGTTCLVVCGASAYSWHLAEAGLDLEGWTAPLSGALTTVIVLSVANLFLKLPALQVLLAAVSVLIFSAYLVYDLARLYSDTDADHPLFQDGIISAVEIYLDIVNLFLSLLSLLGSSDD